MAKGGTLNMAKLAEVLRNMGQIKSATELNEMCQASGVIPNAVDFASFQKMMGRSLAAHDSKADILLAFSVFDKDGNGYIAASELRHVLTNLGEKLSETQVNDMLAETEGSADGRIRYVEFVERMLARGENL